MHQLLQFSHRLDKPSGYWMLSPTCHSPDLRPCAPFVIPFHCSGTSTTCWALVAHSRATCMLA